MKKTFSFLAVICMAAVANATILRVSNVTGSSAPYSSIDEALGAANAGDTIMVDGSAIDYGNISIGKRVVLLGPGYFLNENGINLISPAPARVKNVEMVAEGVVMQGMTVENGVDVLSPRCVISRCRISGDIQLWGPHDEGKSGNANNCVIQQNLLSDKVWGDYKESVRNITISNVLITNNIFLNGGSSYVGVIEYLKESTIAYNTWTTKTSYTMLHNIFNSTINNNIFPLKETDGADKDGSASATVTNLYNARNNNVFLFESRSNLKSWEWDSLKSPYYGHTNTDLAIKTVEDELYKDIAGAFSGDTPYVISGIPAGPVIQDLVVPASVEKGSKLQVTIKVGIQQ